MSAGTQLSICENCGGKLQPHEYTGGRHTWDCKPTEELGKSIDGLIETAMQIKRERDVYRRLLSLVLRGATAHRWHCNSDEPDLFAEIKQALR